MRDGANREARETLSPATTEPGTSHGYTPPRDDTTAEATSRIPKLSVHFPDPSESDENSIATGG